jgi:hypothetical protein
VFCTTQSGPSLSMSCASMLFVKSTQIVSNFVRISHIMLLHCANKWGPSVFWSVQPFTPFFWSVQNIHSMYSA